MFFGTESFKLQSSWKNAEEERQHKSSKGMRVCKGIIAQPIIINCGQNLLRDTLIQLEVNRL